MRVVSGLARGHKLISAEGEGIRPTSDKVKEAIFSSLGGKVYNACFLDLFSGSGAMGIEALSRDCSYAAFVEINKAHADVIRQNINHVIKAIPGANYDVFNLDAFEAINMLSKNGKKFDIIFVDPPYGKDEYFSILEKIFTAGVLNENGLLVIENAKENPEPSSKYFNIVKSKQYGKTAVYFMESM